MNGVTILSELGNNVSAMLVTILVSAIFYVLAATVIYNGIRDRMFKVCTISIIPLILAVIFTIATIQLSIEPQLYTVAVDDTVSFAEFTSKYQIINQEGQIYIVREMNNENE